MKGYVYGAVWFVCDVLSKVADNVLESQNYLDVYEALGEDDKQIVDGTFFQCMGRGHASRYFACRRRCGNDERGFEFEVLNDGAVNGAHFFNVLMGFYVDVKMCRDRVQRQMEEQARRRESSDLSRYKPRK